MYFWANIQHHLPINNKLINVSFQENIILMKSEALQKISTSTNVFLVTRCEVTEMQPWLANNTEAECIGGCRGMFGSQDALVNCENL